MKTAIIGAGICGLYLAWKLAERGEEVTVFEKREKIGKEVCSGLFSEKILNFIPGSKKLIQNEISAALIHFPKKTVKIEFAEKLLVMNHAELDNLAAGLARGAGAKIILSRNVTRNDLVAIQKEFDKVIGCDGPNSIVRKNLGLPEPFYRFGIQGFLPKEDYANYIETWPVGGGFIWKIPRNARVTEYGIIAGLKRAKNIGEEDKSSSSPRAIARVLDDFLAKNKISLGRAKAALIPQGFLIPKDSLTVTLCGDAAGLTKPWSGGGVIWGLLAANLLLKNFPDFLKYQKEVKRFFLSKIIFSKIAVKTVYFFGFNIPWLMPRNVKIESDFLI